MSPVAPFMLFAVTLCFESVAPLPGCLNSQHGSLFDETLGFWPCCKKNLDNVAGCTHGSHK